MIRKHQTKVASPLDKIKSNTPIWTKRTISWLDRKIGKGETKRINDDFFSGFYFEDIYYPSRPDFGNNTPVKNYSGKNKESGKWVHQIVLESPKFGEMIMLLETDKRYFLEVDGINSMGLPSLCISGRFNRFGVNVGGGFYTSSWASYEFTINEYGKDVGIFKLIRNGELDIDLNHCLSTDKCRWWQLDFVDLGQLTVG